MNDNETQLKAVKAGYRCRSTQPYKALTNGGQIHFSTEYPHLLNALHHWIDAQIKEHGSAALPEREQHHASPAE